MGQRGNGAATPPNPPCNGDGRPRQGQQEWMAAARRLSTTAEQALKAAEAKNVEALFATGGEIYNACRACHQRYAPDPPDAAPQKAAK